MERYTPGDSPSVTSFMTRRTLASHGAFFGPFLWPGARVLDCGCGPGSITRGLAAAVAPGGVVCAVDANSKQLEVARATLEDFPQTEFRTATVYSLPFADDSFDAVFSHALFEHLAEPERAAQELFRVLKTGGIAGLRSPDFSGKLAGPGSVETDSALAWYEELQRSNGGNLRIGRSLGSILASAGFQRIRTSASYECYRPVSLISKYLAQQMESAACGGGSAEARRHAAALREWSRSPHAFFAQAWIEVIAERR